jgi:hypothetical protein
VDINPPNPYGSVPYVRNGIHSKSESPEGNALTLYPLGFDDFCGFDYPTDF